MIVVNRILVIGTGNPGKLNEIQTILGGVQWTIRSLNDYEPVREPEENGASYAENAIIKAKYYAATTGKPTLADDSGLEVSALNGVPGLQSARYAGAGASDKDRRQLLLSELQKSGVDDRSARFVCAVALFEPESRTLRVSEGICEGRVVEQERGTGGFGYDPLFIPNGFEQTFGEIPDNIKNEISHRGRALAKIKEWL
jgi:non-canonical purine NTP pyrophosphatase (RdgB/HAM1 family)